MPKKLIQGVLQFQSEAFPAAARPCSSRLVEEGQARNALYHLRPTRASIRPCRPNPCLATCLKPRNLRATSFRRGKRRTSAKPPPSKLAVSIMNVRRIVICGHSHCAAMGMLLRPGCNGPRPLRCRPGSTTPKPRGGSCGSTIAICARRELVRATVEENVVVQRFWQPAVASVSGLARFMKGNLELHGCVATNSRRARCSPTTPAAASSSRWPSSF